MQGSGDYFHLSGQGEAGPLDAAALRDLHRRGKITDTTLVRQGNGPWITYAEHPELLAPAAAPAGERRYAMNAANRWVMTAMAIFIGGGGLIVMGVMLWTSHFSPGMSAFALGLGVTGATMGYVFLWEGWNGCLLLSPEWIEQRSLFRAKRISCGEIAGYRIRSNKNGKYLVVVAKPPRDMTLTINNSYANSSEIWAWIEGNFPNLDAIELAEATERLLADPRLGATREERAARLAQARRMAWAVCVPVVLLSLVSFWPRLPVWGFGLILLLPLAPLALLAVFRGGLVLFGGAAEPRAQVGVGVLIPWMILAIRGLIDFHPLLSRWILLVGCLLFGAALGLLFSWSFQGRQKRAVALLVAALSAFLGYGLLMETDGRFDFHPAQTYPVILLSTEEHHGSKGSVYYRAWVTGWPGHSAIAEFPISWNWYHSAHRNDPAEVVVHPGFWGVPWGSLQRPSHRQAAAAGSWN